MMSPMNVDGGRAGRGVTVAAVAGTAVVVASVGWMLARGRPLEAFYARWMIHNAPSGVVALWLGRLVLRRRPRHGAGRILVAAGSMSAGHVAVAALVDARFAAAGIDDLAVGTTFVPADLPADVTVPLWAMSWLWIPLAVLVFVLLPAVFPDGGLPGRRWRWIGAAAGAGTALLMLAHMITTWPAGPVPIASTEFPLHHRPVTAALAGAGGVLVLAAAVGAVAALVLRWRRAEPARRGPFRAVGTAAISLALVGTITWPWQAVWAPAVLLGLLLLMSTYALAAARYGVHDLDPFLGRAAVATTLAAGITGVYLAVVVGIGALVGGRGESTLLPLIAVAVVAVMVEPARRGSRRLVERLLYGRDTDRGEVLSRLAEHSSSSAGASGMLDEVAELLRRSTGADRAEVWVDGPDGPAAASASGAGGPPGDDPSPGPAGRDRGEPVLRRAVVHQGERLGEVRLHAPSRFDLPRDADKVLDDVARLLGVVLRNQRLADELRDQLEELRRSRQRLVEVHDVARRELERDIHDGAQARLIALRIRVGLVRALAEADAPRVGEELDALATEVDEAVRSLREVARGLHPPVLEESGLPAALRSHARGLPVPVRVHAGGGGRGGVGRYDRAVEGAVYFACLEALQNALRHGDVSQVDIDVEEDGGLLRFAVRDDGVGFDPATVARGRGLANIDDRLAALGGRVRGESGAGTCVTVTGEVPAVPAPGSVVGPEPAPGAESSFRDRRAAPGAGQPDAQSPAAR